MLAEDIARFGDKVALAVGCQQHLQSAREALDRHVTKAIAEELRSRQ
jgi:exonuclease VII small subunit